MNKAAPWNQGCKSRKGASRNKAAESNKAAWAIDLVQVEARVWPWPRVRRNRLCGPKKAGHGQPWRAMASHGVACPALGSHDQP